MMNSVLLDTIMGMILFTGYCCAALFFLWSCLVMIHQIVQTIKWKIYDKRCKDWDNENI